MTLLHGAAERGNEELAIWLVAEGADVNAVDSRGRPPIALVLHAGPWKSAPATGVVKLLIDHGAVPDLGTLAQIGDVSRLGAAIAAGTRVGRLDREGRAALFHAARSNQLAVVRYLLHHGARPNQACNDGQTPFGTACLHALSQGCDADIIRSLLEAGASPTPAAMIILDDIAAVCAQIRDSPGLFDQHGHESPLGYAIHCWAPAALRCLIEAGARPDSEEWRHIERIGGDTSDLVFELRAIAGER
jgi:ankyrin repeat protein